MIDRCDARARDKGLRMVNTCGFDSVPHDLGALYTVKLLPRDAALTVEAFVRATGTFSGGTWQSAIGALSELRAGIRSLRVPTPTEGRSVRGIKPSLRFDADLGAWAVPLPTIDPLVVLRSKHDERVRLLEESLDGWLLMLANALKASPSLGEALQSSAKLIRPPFSEELDLVIKENKLGTPLDQALLNMSTRIKSRIISSSLATVLVGRQTGGDLPSILEQSASTLREMARLEGVVRTKTAEGKMQATVLAVIPFVLLFALHQVDNNWLRPLFQTTIGYVVLMAATILWASAILVARRILTVDI